MGFLSKGGRAGNGSRRALRTGREPAASVLGSGSSTTGAARYEGSLRLDGTFEGSIEVGETLIVGPSGSLTGDIRAGSVVVAGAIRGTVLATDTVELERGARLEGDIQTRTLIVEDGVFFQGNCRMEEGRDDVPALQLTSRQTPSTAEVAKPAGRELGRDPSAA